MKQKQRFTSGSYRRVLIVSLLILLLPLIGLGNENETIISGSEMWDLPRAQTENIRVNPGAVLTITSMLYMDAGTKITVEPGGKLVVDGGTITTATREPWLGIEVLGKPSISQYPDSLGRTLQGQVVLKMGAILENALTGVLAGKINEPGHDITKAEFSFQTGFSGGIIKAESAIFRNNKISVWLTPYQNFNPDNQEMKHNLSYIKNCDFLLTDSDLIEFDPQIFIKLDGVSGISLTGNHFINQVNSENIPDITGIQSLNSSFAVDRDTVFINPSNPEIRLTTFDKLVCGIKALGASTAKTFAVDTSIFIRNRIGVYANGMDNFSVTRSEFHVENPDNDYSGLNPATDSGVNPASDSGANPATILW